MYGDYESQLVQKHCREIESKTFTSIQVQRQADEVEFHIAGLEEGVTRALHTIQEEFEVCDHMDSLA